MRRELVGYLPAELQQTTSVQRWYRVHDVRNSEAQALTIALGSSFRRCRMRSYESESIHDSSVACSLQNPPTGQALPNRIYFPNSGVWPLHRTITLCRKRGSTRGRRSWLFPTLGIVPTLRRRLGVLESDPEPSALLPPLLDQRRQPKDSFLTSRGFPGGDSRLQMGLRRRLDRVLPRLLSA